MVNNTTPDPTVNAKVVTIFQNKCAECHTSSKLNKKTRFAILTTDTKQVLKLTDRQWLKVLARVSNQTMPPKDAEQATNEEAQDIADYIAKRED